MFQKTTSPEQINTSLSALKTPLFYPKKFSKSTYFTKPHWYVRCFYMHIAQMLYIIMHFLHYYDLFFGYNSLLFTIFKAFLPFSLEDPVFLIHFCYDKICYFPPRLFLFLYFFQTFLRFFIYHARFVLNFC